MAVRRLASDAAQPKSFAFNAANKPWVDAQIAKYPAGRQASAVIPLLWQAQKQADGWLPKAAIEHVAEVLEMPPIRVMEVATFYTMFNLEPVGQHFIQLCGTVPCHCMGAEDLKKVLKARIGDERHVTADGKFSWLEVECLGACCNAPMAQINDDYFEDLTPETLGKLIDDLGAGKVVKVGPQNGRKASEPLGGPKTLQDAALYDGSLVGGWQKAFDERVAAQKKAKEDAAKAAEAAKAAGAAPAPAAPAPNAPVVSKPAPAPAAATPVAPAASAKPAAEPAPVGDDAKPELLTAARGGKADDLKLIWGVGPKLEAMLHRMGVFHFDQIAVWTGENLKWVDQNLEGFKGRAERDDWIGQSKKLATGWRPENAVGDKPKK
jgi:NADH-quinone oxidoreductase subunit E